MTDAERARTRFMTTGEPPTPRDQAKALAVQEKVIELASLIGHIVPDGRNKELALNDLENVQTRANRAIFIEGHHR